jgi:hypothetical protein
MGKNNSSPQRRRGRRELNYIFLLRRQKYINCHDELFLFSGLSPENKINPPLRTLRLGGENILIKNIFIRRSSDEPGY